MNVLDAIKVKTEPINFYYEKLEISMTKNELEQIPDLVSELIHHSVVKCVPNCRVGKVLLFDVTPYKKIDPPLLYCSKVNLSEYYFLWKMTLIDKIWDMDLILKEYDNMIKSLRIEFLELDEAGFLVSQMLKFKNVYVRRYNKFSGWTGE